MLIATIQTYLREHDRLVIPRLGLFLVSKEDQSIVFSQLVRRDDGVLRGLLIAAGQNELAAAGMIDRFVFEVHQAIDQGERFSLPGLGSFAPGANGTIRFHYAPELPVEPAAPVAKATPKQAVESVSEPQQEEPVVETAPVAVEEEPVVAQPASSPIEEPEQASQPDVEEVPDDEEEAPNEPDELDELEEDRESARRLRRRVVKPRGAQRQKPDRFVLVAVIAVLLALAAIAYGYYCEWDEQQANERMIERIEQARQTAETPEPTAAETATEAAQ